MSELRPGPASPWRSAHAKRTYLSGALWLAALAFESFADSGTAGTAFAFAVASAIAGGTNFFPAAWRALKSGRLEMNVLMSLALVAAVLINEAVEAATLAFLFSFAELLERAAVARTRNAITRLYELAPDVAEVVAADGSTAEQSSSALVAGDTYRVRAGGRLAADGIVRTGASSVDEATITGESIPVPKEKGDAVLAGTLNQEGTLEIEVTRPAADSALARIIRALRVAEANRAPMEGAVQRFTAVYTPVVTLLAVAVAIIPAVIGVDDPGAWVLRGVTLLVIACPCALVVATPVTIVSALAGAARRGLLVRGGAPLEALARVRAIAVDKTGTITSGELSVERVVVEPPGQERALLARLTALEARTEHPVARAITQHVASLGISASTSVDGFVMSPGLGVAATVDGVAIRAGRDRHVPEAAARFGPPPAGRVQVLVGDSTGALAMLLLADTVRADATAFVRELHELGVQPVVMLSGDTPATAKAVAALVGIDDARGGLLPEEKVAAVRELRERHGVLAMVGDGVNDAPALATADVGIVMGVAGAPATIETADVALMSDELAALPRAIRLARRTVRVVRFNIAIALATKLLLAVGTLLGVVSLSLAVLLGDVGATVLVTASAMRLARFRAALVLGLLLAASFDAPLAAQPRPQSGTVVVTVREAMGMVDGITIRADSISATTDASGRARLVLPAGRRTLALMRIGFVPKRVTVLVIVDSTVTVTVEMAMADMVAAMAEVTISATRTERLAGETPLRVEVLDEMEVDENTLMAPSGISMLLNETPGVRVRSASPSLGTGSVRILGLPGQYTAMLADGLPLYGGAASALGPLDISPVDLKRVEIIKGAASSLYGGQALGGVINMLSKTPTGRNEFLLNRRTMGVADAATWLSRRLSEQSGASLLVSGTTQGAIDVDGDGWGDQARAERWGIRPRFSFDDATGRSLFMTAGFGYDDRRGGTIGNALAPDGSPFREGLMGRRADAGLTLRLPRDDSGHVAVRIAFSTNGRQRSFGAGPIEQDRSSTGFAEVTRVTRIEEGALVVGAAVQADAYHNRLNSAFDHDWITPGLFLTGERDIGRVTLSASVRADHQPVSGVMLTERLALLVRPALAWSVRLSGGTGFAAPTALTEETEAIGLRAIQPSALHAERSVGAMVDVNGRLLGAELLVTGYASSIAGAIQLVDLGTPSLTGALRNASGATRVGGAEAAAIWRFGTSKFLLTYGYAHGTRTDAESGEREAMPLLTRHRLGGDLMLEKPGAYLIGIEGTYHDRQALDDDPYLRESKPYVYAMAIAKRQIGRVEIVANFENLLDVRQTGYQPLVRPTPTVGGRWTTDVWAPLEGFMANVAVRVRWGTP